VVQACEKLGVKYSKCSLNWSLDLGIIIQRQYADLFIHTRRYIGAADVERKEFRFTLLAIHILVIQGFHISKKDGFLSTSTNMHDAVICSPYSLTVPSASALISNL
jgi:hypothetical protein